MRILDCKVLYSKIYLIFLKLKLDKVFMTNNFIRNIIMSKLLYMFVNIYTTTCSCAVWTRLY